MCAVEQGLNKDDISRLKGRHKALLASREALEKGASGGGGDDFIPLDGKVFQYRRGREPQFFHLDFEARQAHL